jgi:hypothetical protein
MRVQQIFEELEELEDNGVVRKFVIVFFHPTDRWHKLDPEDLDDIHVFTTEKAFTTCLGEYYSDFMSGEEPLNIADLHSDPEVQKQLSAKIPPRKEPKDMTMDELKRLPQWVDFIEYATIFNRL